MNFGFEALQQFRLRFPKTFGKGVLSERSFFQAKERHINTHFLVWLPLGRPQVPPYFIQWKARLSQGQTVDEGRQNLCVESLCAFLNRVLFFGDSRASVRDSRDSRVQTFPRAWKNLSAKISSLNFVKEFRRFLG